MEKICYLNKSARVMLLCCLPSSSIHKPTPFQTFLSTVTLQLSTEGEQLWLQSHCGHITFWAGCTGTCRASANHREICNLSCKHLCVGEGMLFDLSFAKCKYARRLARQGSGPEIWELCTKTHAAIRLPAS